MIVFKKAYPTSGMPEYTGVTQYYAGQIVELTPAEEKFFVDGYFAEVYDNKYDYYQPYDMVSDRAGRVTGVIGPNGLTSTFSEFVSVKDFGAVGDGVTDDTAALQAFYNSLAQKGGQGLLPSGMTFGITARIRVTAAMPFQVFGYGAKIKRISDFAASMVEIVSSDFVEHHGVEFDCQFQTFPNANHGLVYSDCNYALVKDVTVRNHKNTGILIFSTAQGLYKFNKIVSSSVYGNSGAPANNGMLIADCDYAVIDNCYAENCSGSPGYGLQLKNLCNWSSVSGRAKNCTFAGAFGNDTAGVGVTESYANIELSELCRGAFDAGSASRNTIRIGTVLSGAIASLNAVNMTNCVGNSIFVGHVRAQGASQAVVRFRTGCSDNVVMADVLFRDGVTVSSSCGIFDSGVTNNLVRVGRLFGATVTRTDSLVTDNSGNLTNVMEYLFAPAYEERTISNGVISVRSNNINTVVVDTEAAAATDDLDTITGVNVEGKVLILRTKADARDVVVRHNVGNIRLNGQTNFTLDAASDSLMLVYNSAVARWVQVSSSNNAV